MFMNMKKNRGPIVGSGIFKEHQIWQLPGFGKVYYGPDCIANILYFFNFVVIPV